MGWFKKALAKVGVGSAEVALIMPKETFMQGETTTIEVTITGGSTPQPIDTISFELCCDYMGWEQIRTTGEQGRKRQRRRMTYSLAKWQLPDTFTLQPGEVRQFDTQCQIPRHTPLTMGDGKVWVVANLDIPMGKDASSKTFFSIGPSACFNAVLEGFEAVGCRIEKVSNQDVERSSLPFEQRIELAPVSGRLVELLQRIELVSSCDDKGLHLALTLYRQGEGLGDALGRLVGANKVERSLTISPDATAELARREIDILLDKIEE
ncbi:sporulation protein [Enterovibrio makurazakiensis]|uniref:Sporulation protein n=1 Tax=Enterovibrio gelatinilyticus TaxID=2899819 RepID=A0ABT5R5K7_9GAMM|nr:sporulation protein [Enterovibrio sp. ZSDZ42]MDD1795562.1 sporulation protein [Enterovibrio sp. ZSDZ42]